MYNDNTNADCHKVSYVFSALFSTKSFTACFVFLLRNLHIALLVAILTSFLWACLHFDCIKSFLAGFSSLFFHKEESSAFLLNDASLMLIVELC